MPNLPTFVFQTKEALAEWEQLPPDEREELVKASSWPLEEHLLDLHDARVKDGLLTPTEAAKRLGVSLDRVYGLMKAKRLPHVNVGGLYRFRPWSVRHYQQRLERERNPRGLRVVARSG